MSEKIGVFEGMEKDFTYELVRLGYASGPVSQEIGSRDEEESYRLVGAV